MTQQELQTKYDQLVEVTRQARGWQKQWFKYHIKSDLEKARIWERKLDKILDSEVKKDRSKQPEIF